MTLDFSSNTGVFSIYTSAVSTAANRLYLYSNYDNEAILNGANLYLTNAYILLTNTTDNDRYQSYTFVFDNTDLETEDIGGYYRMELYSDSIPIPVKNPLVKVTNGFISNGIPSSTTTYISDNEENEQYTLFR